MRSKMAGRTSTGQFGRRIPSSTIVRNAQEESLDRNAGPFSHVSHRHLFACATIILFACTFSLWQSGLNNVVVANLTSVAATTSQSDLGGLFAVLTSEFFISLCVIYFPFLALYFYNEPYGADPLDSLAKYMLFTLLVAKFTYGLVVGDWS